MLFQNNCLCKYVAENDIDPLVRELCRTYSTINKGHSFKYLVSFYALSSMNLMIHMNVTPTLKTNYVHIHFRQTESATPDCIDNIN